MPGTSRKMLILPLAAVAALAALAAAGAAEPRADQIASLREGNRLYREGRLEEAYLAYLNGYWPEAPHPILTYNVATTSHHLGDLPGAILWYRRTESINPGDPWLRENLTHARVSLGLQPYAAPGGTGLMARHHLALLYLAAALAWIGVALWIARPRRSARTAMALVVSGVLLYAIIYLASVAAPRAAVITEACSGAQGDLPAGSEVWVIDEDAESYEIAAGRARVRCPRAAVMMVSATG